MDQSTVLDYGNLTAEQLEYWQKRATFTEWSLRPGPMMTFVKGSTRGRRQEAPSTSAGRCFSFQNVGILQRK